MNLLRGTLLLALAATCLVSPSGAQAAGVIKSSEPGPVKAFAIDAAGGVTGAGLGFGLVSALQSECSRDGDLVSCTIGPAASALLASTVLSTTGTILVGRAAHTKPSVGGAVAGALAGAVVAVGVDHLIREELRVRTNRFGTGVTVAMTQGLFTAIGSRLVSR
jgi:hypothetical protein